MHTMRALVAAALTACLAAGAVSAQAPDAPTLATGVFKIAESAEADETEDGRYWDERGIDAWGWIESDDPRIDGTFGLIVEGQTSASGADDPAFVWGTMMLEAEAGAWMGPMAGWLHEGELKLPLWLVGDGAAAGLVAFVDVGGVVEEAEGGIDVTAFIYEGEVPPGLVPEPAWIDVTGRMDLFVVEEPGETTSEDGVERLRERLIRGEMEMSDPRLSGTVEALVNLDGFDSPDARGRTSLSWGLMGIENDDGRWELEWNGGSGPDGGHSLAAEGSGDDDYEGWSARLRMVPRGGMTGTYDVEGILVEGGLPDWPEAAPEPPAVP